MDDVFLIAGLGNPGREYTGTRHNIGFRIADGLADILGIRFSRQQNHAFIAAGARGGKRVILAKPQTFMNLSGPSVAALVRFYKVPCPRLLVMCDDIDLPGRMDAADYVLRDFESEEEEALPILVDKATQAALTFVDFSLEEAMSRYNGSPAGAPSSADSGEKETS
jgi:PTH1 family peptidyl-tRNA hydrolase